MLLDCLPHPVELLRPFFISFQLLLPLPEHEFDELAQAPSILHVGLSATDYVPHFCDQGNQAL